MKLNDWLCEAMDKKRSKKLFATLNTSVTLRSLKTNF